MSHKYKFHALTNFEIDAWAKKYLPGFGGAIANDEIISKPPGYYIVNLQNSNEPGSDWVFVDTTRRDYSIFWSAFGIPPNLAVERWCNILNPQRCILINSSDFQPLSGYGYNSCGYYCLYIACQLHIAGRTFEDIVLNDFTADLSKLKQNELVLSKFFLRRPIK